jgi:hypothetical protein
MYLVIDICNSHSAFTIDLLEAYSCYIGVRLPKYREGVFVTTLGYSGLNIIWDSG